MLLALISGTVASLPRFSTEKADSCRSCHINPNGGGMRNEFGNFSMAFNELVLPQTKKYLESSFRSPRLAPSLTVGFDSRYLVLEGGRVFRMQTDAYLNLEPTDYSNYQLRIGEDPYGDFRAVESYGQFTIAKRHYVRFGRFAPAFGLRVEDHKSYVRERTGNGSNIYFDGLSLGTTINNANYAVEVYRVSDHTILGLHSFRAGVIGPATYLAGFSMRFDRSEPTAGTALPDSRSLFGGFAYGRFTLLGECSLSGKSPDAMASYVGLTTRLEYGLYLLGEYNYYDPDRHIVSGTDEFYRFSLEIYPIPYFQLRPSYTTYTSGARDGENEFFLQIHFGY